MRKVDFPQGETYRPGILVKTRNSGYPKLKLKFWVKPDFPKYKFSIIESHIYKKEMGFGEWGNQGFQLIWICRFLIHEFLDFLRSNLDIATANQPVSHIFYGNLKN